MFGYVILDKPELKIKEYELFKAYYCSVCRSIGKKNIASRIGLTYDMTFLAVLLSSLYSKNIVLKKGMCHLKMKKVLFIQEDRCINYAADINIIMCRRKLMDNYHDDKNPFSLALWTIMKEKLIGEKAKGKLSVIDSCLNQLTALENKNCSNVDEISDCFGNLTGEIFAYETDDKEKVLRTIGYNIGKWIYIMDAYEDLEEDIAKGRYNPFVQDFKYNGQRVDQFKKKIIENVDFTLTTCLRQAALAYELLNIRRNKGILDNIIYLGLDKKTRNAIGGKHTYEKSI